MSNEFFVLLLVGLSSCGMTFSGRSLPPATGEGTVMVPRGQPGVWFPPCSVGNGTRFTARLDRAIGTDSSRPGEPFTARVVKPVVSSCDLDFISTGAVLRGRVVRAEQGNPPVIALELVDVDTAVGPKPIPAAIRSGAGLAWLETNAPHARSSYNAILLYPSWEINSSHATSDGRGLQLTLPAGDLIELELLESVLVLP